MTNPTGPITSKDSVIKRLDLINSSGQVVNLTNIYVQLQIYQDIFAQCMAGKILIQDAMETFTSFYLCGNEYLHISVDNPGRNAPFERIFRVYKVADRKPISNSGQRYELYFCSDELISSNSLLISKAYKSSKITDVIADVLLNELKVGPERIGSFEDTFGVYDFIIPSYRPFEAIQWATARAYNQNKFCYMFFENKNGFQLSSLQSMMKQKPYKTIRYEVKLSDSDPANNKDSADNFSIVNDFDMISSISNGSFASRLLTIDLFSQKFENLDYSLLIAEASQNLLNKHVPLNSFTNSKDQSLFTAFGSFFRTYTTINDTQSEKSNDIRNWLLPRALHMAMLHHFRLKVTVPGDIEMKAGDVVFVEFPMFEGKQDGGRRINKRLSGKYLVSAVNYKFTREDNTFECVAELVTDSFSEPTPVAKNGLNRLSKKGK
jgi:hypothetical protein